MPNGNKTHNPPTTDDTPFPTPPNSNSEKGAATPTGDSIIVDDRSNSGNMWLWVVVVLIIVVVVVVVVVGLFVFKRAKNSDSNNLTHQFTQ